MALSNVKYCLFNPGIISRRVCFGICEPKQRVERFVEPFSCEERGVSGWNQRIDGRRPKSNPAQPKRDLVFLPISPPEPRGSPTPDTCHRQSASVFAVLINVKNPSQARVSPSGFLYASRNFLSNFVVGHVTMLTQDIALLASIYSNYEAARRSVHAPGCSGAQRFRAFGGIGES
jgi:hypothetical protein